MYITGIKPEEWHTSAKNALGAIGLNITEQGAKQYKYVKLLNESANVTVDHGDMVAYLAAPATDEEISTVVSDFTDADTTPVGAGAVQGDSQATQDFTLDGEAVASIAGVAGTAYYGWVMQSGYAIIRAALGGTVAAGDALTCGTADKSLTLATAADDPICAIGINDTAKTVRLCCI